MTLLIGFGVIIVLFLVIFLIEATAPTVSLELNILHYFIILFAGAFGWGAQEYVTTVWFDLPFREGFFVRVFQVIHSILAIVVALRGFVIGIMITILVVVFAFFKWLIWG